MLPYAVKVGRIPQHIYKSFLEMQKTAQEFPEVPDTDLSCHAVCRVLVKMYPEFQFQDGHFYRNYQHTWIIHPDAPHVIMDMYPVGGGGALIIDGSARLLCWRELYDISHAPNFDKDDVQFQVEYILANSQ